MSKDHILWLDDVRPYPWIKSNFVHIATNYDQAIEILQKYDIDYAYLDHDLEFWKMNECPSAALDIMQSMINPLEKTGYDVVKWMQDNNKFPKKMAYVHSANPVGAERMARLLADHYESYYRYHIYNYLNLKMLIDPPKLEWKDDE